MAINDEPKPGSREGKHKIDLRILLADDNPGTAADMKMMLGLKYSRIETVENGQVLLERLVSSGEVPDFVLTDYNMPKVNGLEAIRKMRAVEHLKSVPVIIMSGDLDSDPIKKEAESLGAVFMERPVDIDELYAAIERMRQQKT